MQGQGGGQNPDLTEYHLGQVVQQVVKSKVIAIQLVILQILKF